MNATSPKRVIALDLHPLSFGYAVFDAPDELIDWGIKSFRHGVNTVKVPRGVKLALLLDRYEPDTLVIREPKTAKLKTIARAISNLVQSRRIRVRCISRDAVRRAFPGESHNKYEIALVIAKRHPELSARLGPRRKVWQAERYSMSIFDAMALGIAYFMHYSPVNKQEANPLAGSSLTYRP